MFVAKIESYVFFFADAWSFCVRLFIADNFRESFFSTPSPMMTVNISEQCPVCWVEPCISTNSCRSAKHNQESVRVEHALFPYIHPLPLVLHENELDDKHRQNLWRTQPNRAKTPKIQRFGWILAVFELCLSTQFTRRGYLFHPFKRSAGKHCEGPQHQDIPVHHLPGQEGEGLYSHHRGKGCAQIIGGTLHREAQDNKSEVIIMNTGHYSSCKEAKVF